MILAQEEGRIGGAMGRKEGSKKKEAEHRMKAKETGGGILQTSSEGKKKVSPKIKKKRGGKRDGR